MRRFDDGAPFLGRHRVGQQVFERSEHESQRRAEFMADIGEEGGLGAVELGQGLAAPALRLIGVGAGDRVGDLRRQPAEEGAVAGPGQAVGIEAHEHQRVALGLVLAGHGQHRHRVAGTAQNPGGQGDAEARLGIGDQLELSLVEGRQHRPTRTPVERQAIGDGRMVGGGAGGGDPRQHLLAGLVAPIERGEHDVAAVVADAGQGAGTGVAPGAGVDRGGGDPAQQGQLAFGNHPAGIVGIGADDPARRAVIVGDRAVGEGVVGLLGIAVALHDQELLLDIGALDAAHGGGQHRTDLGPDLAPHLAGRAAQRPGMLAADDREIGVVIEIGQLGSPADPDRLARRQHDADGGPEALRPGFGRAQGRRGPVVRADQAAHVAAAGQKIERGWQDGRHACHRASQVLSEAAFCREIAGAESAESRRYEKS